MLFFSLYATENLRVQIFVNLRTMGKDHMVRSLSALSIKIRIKEITLIEYFEIESYYDHQIS